MKRILVLRGGALGDFLVALPALALLRERWPSAHLTLVGNATAAALALTRGLLDAVHSQHQARWSTLFGEQPLASELSAWLADFDLVINYWPDPENELRRRFPIRTGQLYLAAAAMPAKSPAAAHYCEPLRLLGLEPSTFHYPLAPLSNRSGANLEDGGASANRILIHPGSGSPRKNWPRANWRELIERLDLPVTVIIGEAELNVTTEKSAKVGGVPPPRGSLDSRSVFREVGAPRLQERRSMMTSLIERWTDATPANWPVQTLVARPLEELVSHLSRCRLFVGHDSGISHLAAAAGANCVLLFGPTDSAMWAPPAPEVRVLRRGPELAAISVGEVAAAVSAALADRK